MPAKPTRKRRDKTKAMVAYLSMVSLMDMFTIILLFLLHAFSAGGEVFTEAPGFKLPLSTASEPVSPRLTIQLTQEAIIVEGKKVVSLNELSGKGLLIGPLFERLKEEAKKSVFIAGVNPSFEVMREVIILGDRGIPFEILERVMYTCGEVGYNNIRLAVIELEG